ncbi:hypothetical protein ACQ4M3_37890 [Leptolyngbya sp. AN03gr2]|uniref:hypothetical protein n=1 Tax=unclassified Leptolyngbya TaxID=2650499 RepID=UPI003D31C3CE
MSFAQFIFLTMGVAFIALLAFVLLTVYEQFGICSSTVDKTIALLSSAIGAIVGAEILAGYSSPPLLLIAFLVGGAIQIWYSCDRSG